MPIYEYQCQDCGHVFDALQKMSDEPLRDCPDCGKAALRKLLSAPAFRLKGGGWYETDFKDDSKEKRNLAGDAGKDKGTDKDADKPGPDKKSDKKSGDGADKTSGSGKSGNGSDSSPSGSTSD